MSRVLCVAAHPDDEALMCGGTLAKHAAGGDYIVVLFMADGVGGRGWGEAEAKARAENAKAACAHIGVAEVRFEQFLDNEMDTHSLLSMVKDVERVVSDVSPRIVYTHWHGDLNIDHSLTSRAVATAVRPQPKCTVRRLLFGECASNTEWGHAETFRPNYFVEIDINRKLEMLGFYGTEMREAPHARSLEAVQALATWRGAIVGVKAAEAFVLGRMICA